MTDEPATEPATVPTGDPAAEPGAVPTGEPAGVPSVESAGGPTQVPAQPGPAARWRSLLRYGFVAATVAVGGYAVADQWTQVRAALDRLAPAALLGAFLAVLIGLFGSMLVWRTVLADLGSRLPVRDAAWVFFVGQLGKYLPGSVWPLLAQMELAQGRDVPRQRSAAAFVLTALLMVCSGLAVAAGTLPFFASAAAHQFRWALAAAPLLALVLHPRVLNPAVGALLRLARRPPLERPLSAAGIGTAFGWAVACWTAYGAQLWLLAVTLGADALRALPLCLGGFALAWSAGFLLVIAPAGAGVREVALVAGLAPVLPRGQALVAAVVSRLLMTLGDLAGATSAGWLGRRRLGASGVARRR